MRANDELAARIGTILDRLGWHPEATGAEGVAWAWLCRPTPDVAVRVLHPNGSPLVHVESTLRFTSADAQRMAEGAALSAQLKLHLLGANLEYDFQDDARGRAVTFADYVAADDITLASVGRSVRRVKDAHYAALVMLQTGGAPTQPPRAGTHATLTTVAVAPETWQLLQDALTPGQTVDELIAGLLRRRATP